MTDKEAMKLALEALELLTGAWQTFDALDYGDNAIAALKERLADPMREVQRLGQELEQKIGCVNHDCEQCKAQRTWVGLTDEDCKGMGAGDKVVAMWADRTLKEKNT